MERDGVHWSHTTAGLCKIDSPVNLLLQRGCENVVNLSKKVVLPPAQSLLNRGLIFIPTNGSKRNLVLKLNLISSSTIGR